MPGAGQLDRQSPSVGGVGGLRNVAEADQLADTLGHRLLGDLNGVRDSEDDLLALLDPEARLVEHPNPVRPAGATSNVDETIIGFRAGKALLSRQAFDVHEVLVCGDRAAVRTTWSGTIARDAGPYLAGKTLVSHIGGFLTVRDGRVVDHETFDCYEPFATAAGEA